MIVPRSIKRVTVATLSILATSSFHSSGAVHAIKLDQADQLNAEQPLQEQQAAVQPKQAPENEDSIGEDAQSTEGGLDPEQVANAANTILDEDYTSGDPLIVEIVDTGNGMLDV